MIPCSLVTTCRNEMRSFARWKANMQAQTRFPDEVVIVDAFSDDGTWEALTDWAKEDSRLKVLQEKGAAAHGRNVAIQNAKYDHVISTDMGVRLDNCFCEEMMRPFEDNPNIKLVIGSSYTDSSSIRSIVAKTEKYITSAVVAKIIAKRKPGSDSKSLGGNRAAAYEKSIWEECGRLPEDLTFYADDSTLFRQFRQAGYPYAYAPKAKVYWGRPEKLKQFWKEAFNYGRGDGEAAIKMSRTFKWFLQKKIPAWLETWLNAIRYTYKQFSFRAIINSLKKGDFGVMFVMPVFAFGVGWNQSKGYHTGYANGCVKCQACRARLEESKQNIAFDRRFTK